MLRAVCSIPRCSGLAPGRRGIMCHEHWAMVAPRDQQQLTTLWKSWRGGRKGSLGLGAYRLWHDHAAVCIAWVLVKLWEGAFPIPLGAEPCHRYGATPCPCPICVEARAVADKLPSARRYVNPRVIHGAARAAG